MCFSTRSTDSPPHQWCRTIGAYGCHTLRSGSPPPSLSRFNVSPTLATGSGSACAWAMAAGGGDEMENGQDGHTFSLSHSSPHSSTRNLSNNATTVMAVTCLRSAPSEAALPMAAPLSRITVKTCSLIVACNKALALCLNGHLTFTMGTWHYHNGHLA